MSMPPMLRWALGRLPISDEEKERLEREEFEATGFVANIERMLVAVDASPSGQLASRLAGLIAGVRRLTTTVIHIDYEPASPLHEGKRQADRTRSVVKEHAAEGGEAAQGMSSGGLAAAITTRVEKDEDETIAAEAKKGYGLLVIGLETASEGADFHQQIVHSAAEFAGPFAITIARGVEPEKGGNARLNILVLVDGTATAHRGAEVAVVLAQASRAPLTVLHFETGQPTPSSWQRHFGAAVAPMSGEDAVICEIVRLGEPYGVDVKRAASRIGTVTRGHFPADQKRGTQPRCHGRQLASRRSAVIRRGGRGPARTRGMFVVVCGRRAFRTADRARINSYVELGPFPLNTE
jgi:nucleotide-binding universal stress UspA family protein